MSRIDAKTLDRWIKRCEEQLARGNPYATFEPECKDIIALIDEVKELRKQVGSA